MSENITAKVIAASVNELGNQITTVQLKYPRFIHSEVMTHRVFSRNASSSRAIPVAKMLEQVRTAPAMPEHWGLNRPGMQAREELNDNDKQQAKETWMAAANSAADFAEKLSNLGLHKQASNRILEPFQHIHVVVTSTEWDNFFALRDHKDAQPEIQILARKIKEAMSNNTPTKLLAGQWHLPYMSADEIGNLGYLTAAKCSAARCARVSYLKHDGSNPSYEDDIELFNQLVTRPFTDKRGNVLNENDPPHYSPLEHQATPDSMLNNVWAHPEFHGNFVGWVQHRRKHQFNVDL